jgi:serine/threonine-protein kinase RsbW
MIDLDLEIPPKPEYIRTARHAVAALARLHQVPDNVAEEIRLAVSEACTNALQANVAAGSTEAIRVLAMTEGADLLVEVRDRGSGARVSLAGDPGDLDTGDLPFESLLSLPIIRGLIDELEVLPREGGGSIVRMRMPAGPAGGTTEKAAGSDQ